MRPGYLHICSNKLSDFYIRIETGRDRPRSGAVRRFVNNKIPSIDEPLHISRIYVRYNSQMYMRLYIEARCFVRFDLTKKISFSLRTYIYFSFF